MKKYKINLSMIKFKLKYYILNFKSMKKLYEILYQIIKYPFTVNFYNSTQILDEKNIKKLQVKRY